MEVNELSDQEGLHMNKKHRLPLLWTCSIPGVGMWHGSGRLSEIGSFLRVLRLLPSKYLDPHLQESI